MPLKTDYNVSPYFDDYDETKNFHRILFNPHLAVQARELTQLQTILQTQIERFGDNILREGTIVTGGNFVEETALHYVKIQDFNLNNEPVSVIDYVGLKLTGTVTGLEAVIVAAENGFETQAPNLNTVWVKYTNTAISAVNGEDVKVFNNGENLEVTSVDGVTNFNTIVAATTSATGVGYGVRCGDGIIYQKGQFVRFNDSLTIISKYDNQPNGVVVGFKTLEEIVTFTEDDSLLDNANSFNNYNAPGADRVKLTPVLTVATIAESQADESFFALQEYQNGRVVRRKLDTVYSKVGDMMAKRTKEESGNYIVEGMDVGLEKSLLSEDFLAITVDPGVGYVNGYRVSLSDSFKIQIPQGNDTVSVTEQEILINYGNYVVVENMQGVFDIDSLNTINLYDGVGSGGAQIGTARVLSVTSHVVTDATHRIYLFDVKVDSGRNFSEVKSVSGGVNGQADLVLVNGAAKVNEAAFNSLLFQTTDSSLKNFIQADSEYVYRTKEDTTAAVQTISLNAPAGSTFTYGSGSTLSGDQLDDIIIINNTTNQVAPTLAASTDVSGTNLTITTDFSGSATVFFDIRKSSVNPTGKTTQTFDVTIDTLSHPNGANGPWSLGVPDAYQIVSVIKNDANSTDLTNKFILNSGQTETHYGLSYITAPRGSLQQPDAFTITFKAFDSDSVSNQFDQSFFTVDSYHDVDIIDIPTFKNENEELVDLRDTIDFRPHADATFAGLTATNPSDVLSFDNTPTLNLPTPNSLLTASYEYYIGRFDRLVIDQNGEFGVVEGEPSTNPVLPILPNDTMVLADFYIPPYPSLPSTIANSLKKPAYAVRFTKKNNRRYTMSDIRDLDQRITNLEYYTSLSTLEKNTKDLLVLDENGLNRFKNGIFVDSFKDLRMSDVTNADYSSSIDFSETAIQPKFTPLNIDLKMVSSTGIADYGEVLTLENSDVLQIDQPFATAVKNCTTSFYNFRGEMFLTPESDSQPDVTTSPDINIDLDLVTPFTEFNEYLRNVIPAQRETRKVTSDSKIIRKKVSPTSHLDHGTDVYNETTTTTQITTTTQQLDIDSNLQVNEVGDFVTDVQMSPWIRAREVKVYVAGLRPNTRFYPFFNEVSITEHCRPAIYNAVGVTPSTVIDSVSRRASSIRASGAYGDEIRSTSSGELYFVFDIPAETFKVGDRKLEVFDALAYNSIDSLTSYASKIYNGFNFSVSKSTVSTATRMPELEFQSSSSTRVFTKTDMTLLEMERPRDALRVDNIRQVLLPPTTPGATPSLAANAFRYTGNDPLIQSFIIDENATEGSSTLLKGVDIFFNTKSDTAGITVMIREMKDGVPTGVIVPLSKVHLSSDEVSTSTDASVATRINFNAPIPVKTNTEYGICLMPDGSNPDYRVWISRVGEKDVLSNLNVTHDTNSGMIFTSTNNRSWTPYQNENLKYRLYTALFESGSQGQATFKANNMEFLTIENTTSAFQKGEKVYTSSSVGTGTITLTQGSSTVSGNGTQLATELVTGDWIVVYGAGAVPDQLVRISESSNITATAAVLDELPMYSVVGASFDKVVVATVSDYTSDETDHLVLYNSFAYDNADGTVIFDAGLTVIGELSLAQADIVSVDVQGVSFLQPNIRRVNLMGASSNLTADVYNNFNGRDAYSVPYNSNLYLTKSEALISSKSLVESNQAEDTFFTFNLETTNTTTSSLIDYQSSSLIGYKYEVNGLTDINIDSERATAGEANSKHICKTVTLANDMDSEDLKVFLTAYRPPNTDVEVYCKMLSTTDPRSQDQVGWTRMVSTNQTSSRSSADDRFDYRELQFRLPADVSVDSDTASYSVAAGFQYTDTNGTIHTNFKKFAIKVVLLSNSYNVVPRVSDIRGIALT